MKEYQSQKNQHTRKSKRFENRFANRFESRFAKGRQDTQQKKEPISEKPPVRIPGEKLGLPGQTVIVHLHEVTPGNYPIEIAQKYGLIKEEDKDKTTPYFIPGINRLRAMNTERNHIFKYLKEHQQIKLKEGHTFKMPTKTDDIVYWDKEKGYIWNIDPGYDVVVGLEFESKAPQKDENFSDIDYLEGHVNYYMYASQDYVLDKDQGEQDAIINKLRILDILTELPPGVQMGVEIYTDFNPNRPEGEKEQLIRGRAVPVMAGIESTWLPITWVQRGRLFQEQFEPIAQAIVRANPLIKVAEAIRGVDIQGNPLGDRARTKKLYKGVKGMAGSAKSFLLSIGKELGKMALKTGAEYLLGKISEPYVFFAHYLVTEITRIRYQYKIDTRSSMFNKTAEERLAENYQKLAKDIVPMIEALPKHKTLTKYSIKLLKEVAKYAEELNKIKDATEDTNYLPKIN